tara:strand:- start:2907 stop:3365 length:459 start_codon:yes stop_codon:yes gene_type:complete
MKKNLDKTISRLAAIQSVFQSFFDNQKLEKVAKQFNNYRFNENFDNKNFKLSFEKNFYNKLILYIENFDLKYDINDYFSNYLTSKRPYSRLDIITKSILIVATSEILKNKTVNKKIIINDYVEITKSFMNKPEVSFINAILDKIYKYEETKK